jgi:hypothetical protein
MTTIQFVTNMENDWMRSAVSGEGMVPHVVVVVVVVSWRQVAAEWMRKRIARDGWM